MDCVDLFERDARNYIVKRGRVHGDGGGTVRSLRLPSPLLLFIVEYCGIVSANSANESVTE